MGVQSFNKRHNPPHLLLKRHIHMAGTGRTAADFQHICAIGSELLGTGEGHRVGRIGKPIPRIRR